MQHNMLRKAEASSVDDEVELKNFFHSTKKFLLRYVLSVITQEKQKLCVAWWLICNLQYSVEHFPSLVRVVISFALKLDYCYNWSSIFGLHFGWVFASSSARQISSSEKDYWGRSSLKMRKRIKLNFFRIFSTLFLSHISERFMHSSKHWNLHQCIMHFNHSSSLSIFQLAHSQTSVENLHSFARHIFGKTQGDTSMFSHRSHLHMW